MKPFLLFPDRDLPPTVEDDVAITLRIDLDIDALLDVMADGDAGRREIQTRVLLAPLTDVGEIRYRQAIVRDMLGAPGDMMALYEIAGDALETKRKSAWGIYGVYPSSILYGSVQAMGHFVGYLQQMRSIVDRWAPHATSDGLRRWFAAMQEELSDGYLIEIENHLKTLDRKGSVPLTSGLGAMNESTNLTVAASNRPRRSWLARLFEHDPDAHTIRIAERDESGARALTELRDRGINDVANALAQSVDHLVAFFKLVRQELAFYIGAVALHGRLEANSVTLTFPELVARGEGIKAKQLHPATLALRTPATVVANDFDTAGRPLAIITGANQGGKSTFLRTLGQAQLMTQAGLFVTAAAFSTEVFDGLFSHFKRAEDAAMVSGKFDEELVRWDRIISHLGVHGLVLTNESFASTNDREGSILAEDVFRALGKGGHTVLAVTHLYPLAATFQHNPEGLATQWVVERDDEGQRSFKIHEGAPTESSFAGDIFAEVFGRPLKTAHVSPVAAVVAATTSP